MSGTATDAFTPKIRRLTRREIGPCRLTFMSALGVSPDPYMSVLYEIDIDRCREVARATGQEQGVKITLGTVLNKMIGVAIAENPIFNKFVLGGSLYEIEGIHIANSFMIPVPEQALAFVMLSNPHLKSLPEIQREFNSAKERKTREYLGQNQEMASRIAWLYFKTGAYRLISARLAFTAGFKKGLTSNIMISNHSYGGPGNFTVLKPVIAPNAISLRIHACGSVSRPALQDGRIATKEVLPLHVVIDHRIIWGIHIQQFGESLKRIAERPEDHLT